MNIYDHAHELARAMKNSEEYQKYKELGKKVNSNEHCKSMMDDFRKRQMEVQSLQMMGQEVDEKKLKELEELHKIIMQNSLLSEYIHAEFKLSQLLKDIYKILGDVLDMDG